MVDSEHEQEQLQETTQNVDKAQTHDQAKAELIGSDHSDQEGHESEEAGKEEVFQDCLEETAFAKQFDQVVADGTDYTNDDENGSANSEEENKNVEENDEPPVEQNVSLILPKKIRQGNFAEEISVVIFVFLLQLELALSIKQEGTALYKVQEWQGAVDKYTLAIAHCPETEAKQKAMIYNNLGMVLMHLHDPEAATEPAASAAAETEEKPFMSSLQKKRSKNANRDKALKRAKEQFGKALELDEAYIKPRF